MSTSPKSQSTCNEAERTALRQLFWKRGVMNRLRKGDEVVISFPVTRPKHTKDLVTILFASAEAHKELVSTVRFQILSLFIGDETWSAIVGRIDDGPLLRIVEPFLVPGGDPANIGLFEEEV